MRSPLPLERQQSFKSDFPPGTVPPRDSVKGGILGPDMRRCRLAPGQRQKRNQRKRVQTPAAALERALRMRLNDTSNFKAMALSDETLRSEAPSIFASGPMQGVSNRYTFVPTAQI